jgi:hypothetical protein
VAEEMRPDLIVMGKHGQTEIESCCSAASPSMLFGDALRHAGGEERFHSFCRTDRMNENTPKGIPD